MFAPPLSSEREEGDSLLIHLTTLKQDIQDAHAQARETLKTKQKRMKADYDIKARSYQYAMGDAVYVCDRASIKGVWDKLKSSRKGPGLVLAMLTPYLLKIQIRNSVTVANHDHVKACRDRNLRKGLLKARQRLKNDGPVYCICRGPDTGRSMVQCDKCLEWFHCECVEMGISDARASSEYPCPECLNEDLCL